MAYTGSIAGSGWGGESLLGLGALVAIALAA
jgi:hypothetical protein